MRTWRLGASLRKAFQVTSLHCISVSRPLTGDILSQAGLASTPFSAAVTAELRRDSSPQQVSSQSVSSPRGMVHTRAQATAADQQPNSSVVYTVGAAHHHVWPGNQEGPRRVDAIVKELQQQKITPERLSRQLTLIKEWLPASEDAVQRVHDAAYVRWLSQTVRDSTPKVVADPEIPEEVTYVTSTSYADALQAAGAGIRLVDEVARASSAGQGMACPVGFSIARPPGHHCGVSTASGFCLLNNVAIAARHAQLQHGFKRVLIFDFDVHCGNGTVDIFYEDPDVLVIDMHEADVWPHTGDLHQTGRSSGRGTTIDIPLPVDSGHQAASAVFERVIVPAARRFRPDLVLVSAGYDAHWRDPLAGLNFQSCTYHLLAQKLKHLAAELCGGRLVFLLEGGYSSEGLACSVAETFLGLLDKPPVHPLDSDVPPEPQADVEKLIKSLRTVHGLAPEK